MLFVNNKHTPSISRDFSFFALITIFICALAMLILVCISHNSDIENKKYNLEKEAKNIEVIISETFNYSNKINSYLGKRIADHGGNDINFILKIFKEADTIQYKTTDLFSWTSFDWVDSKGFQKVNSKIGIRKNPINMYERKYTTTAPKNPWTLQLSHPVLGNPSQTWVIPAATGIVDKNNKYLGSVVIGFNVEEFITKICQRINKDISFIVLDDNLNIIMQSRDNKIDRKSSKNFKFNNNLFNKDSDFLSKKITINDVEYSYYTKLNKYPYIVMTGFSKSFSDKEFNKIVFPSIIGFISITLFFLLMLYLFKSRIMNLLFQERELKKSLEFTNESKTNLIRATTHDLKNYILGISGISNMILENKKSSQIAQDEDLQMIKVIHEQSKELLQFVEDLLDTNQIEIGQYLLKNSSEININQAIHRIIALTKNSSIEYKVSIKTDLGKNLPHITGDFRRIKQIFCNLINSALKYSNRDTIIGITTKYLEKDKEILVEIKDQGIGMSKEEIDLALKGSSLTTDKSELNNNIDSNGIGLPTVKRLVELHNGRLEIESEKGIGTTIKLYFKALYNENQLKEDATKIMHDFKHEKTILLVEDNQVNARITSNILQSANCNVKLAEDGKKAVEIFEKEKFDLILMDIEMPIMNGYEASKIIRTVNKEIPIIALTSHSDKKSIEEARKSGINQVLDKSSNKRELLDLLVTYFSKK